MTGRMSHCISSAAATVIFMLLLAPVAHADEPLSPVMQSGDAVPDKSGYTVFNPVPDALMRSFNTDRPTKSNSPYTVDAGHFQYEADLVNSVYDHYNSGGQTVSNTLVADPTLKLGLTNHTDLEVALAPINRTFTTDRASSAKAQGNGFGDVYTRVKFNLLGNDGGDYALALVPYVKVPTASHTVGNGHWEGGAYAPLSVALPDDWSGTVMTEVDVLENAALNGTHQNYQNLINFGHPIGNSSNNLTGYVEFYSDINADPAITEQASYTADFAMAWVVRDNLQLDIGANFGLNKAAPDLQGYIGISQRF